MSPNTAPHGPFPKIPEGSSKIVLGALVFDGADLLDIMGPMRVFGEELNTLNIEIKFISATSTLKPIRTSHQVEITPHYTIENAPKLDLFFIPGGPNVDWVKKARWVQDGKFVTSAGVSAGIDAALYVVSELASFETAEKVSVNMEYTWHKIAEEDPFADMFEYTRS
ncbi:hypothetical protein BGZ98_007994 [Dissophora globulifera]|nr:hypothetical protein BGZ98_007994 [Dissophora globulifera]